MPRFISEDRLPITCQTLPDGSLSVTGTLSSVGVMRYTWGLEAVGEDCLADPEWVRTAHAPITLEHPPGSGTERLLTPEKVARYSDPSYDGPGKIIPGSVRVWWDGGQKSNKIEVRVFDKDVATGIQRGMYDLSPGYLTPEVDENPGTLDGQRYDVRQKKRVGNHIALILAKEFGGRGGRGAEARFDAGETGNGGQMTPDEVKKMIDEALAAYAAADKAQDEAMLKGGADMGARLDAVASRLDKCDESIARLDAALAPKAEESMPEDKPRLDADQAPAEKSEKSEKAEEEARMDAADEANVIRLAGARGLDVSQPAATLRNLLLQGTGYTDRPRHLQRIYVGELAKHVRVDANDNPFGFKAPPRVPNGPEQRNLVDFSSRLADRKK